jgi:hypothetical protein
MFDQLRACCSASSFAASAISASSASRKACRRNGAVNDVKSDIAALDTGLKAVEQKIGVAANQPLPRRLFPHRGARGGAVAELERMSFVHFTNPLGQTVPIKPEDVAVIRPERKR